MIIFKKLRWMNFLSTGNVFTEIFLNENNTTLIIGENGAGKSTILDALSFVLFGKPFRKINKPQLLNSINQKGLLVEVEFSIQNKEYKIIRGMKPSVFKVFQNETLMNQSAEMKDYQEILEKQILKVNHKSFCQVVVLGSATFQPFMQLSAFNRREIIEDLLELQIFTTMNSLLKDKLTDNNELLRDKMSEKKIIDSKIELTKKHLFSIQSNNENIISEKQILIKETEIKIQNNLNKLEKLIENVKELNAKIVDHDKLNNKITKLSQLKHQIEAKVALLNRDVDFFDKHKDCPTCKQSIREEFREKTINEKKNVLAESQEGLNRLAIEYETSNNRLNEIKSILIDIRNKEMEIYKLETDVKTMNNYIKELEKDINLIENKQIKETDNNIADYENELKELELKIVSIKEDRKVLNAASILLKDGGIKARIIRQYIPVINKLINKYLSAMEFMCQFELNEEFNETIKSRFRDEFSYESFSEGEKMRINLAILFTWRAVAKLRNSINTNLLIMDEVFDSSLDSNGTEEFLKIIKSLTSETNTFIISHKGDQLYDKFDKVIKFEKHKNFSRLVS
jgi:DNA repair exonuclease SbcCD ATPase subunit